MLLRDSTGDGSDALNAAVGWGCSSSAASPELNERPRQSAGALAVMQPRFLMSELLGIGDRVHAEPAMTLAEPRTITPG